MLPQQYRLPKYHIQPTIKHGKRVFFSLGTMFYHPQPHESHWAIIVHKKKKMTAAERNRIKRLVRNALVALLKESPIPVQAVLIVNLPPNHDYQQAMAEIKMRLC